ncbi:MAG TPA: exodeoxyribonuclease VII large subunit [Bacteroidales bacterium]|nr:exodeoxyribonuclease VII large subunit [Bacteroidales bacterium]HPK30067.1 exodeoxyribonuclease VII large subunit [Bacteroidales bacterium]
MDDGKLYTLYQLQSDISEVLAEAFTDSLWVRSEVSECSVNRSGHCYLTLVEKEEKSGRLLAKCSAVIWAQTYRILSAHFRSVTGSDIVAGMNILVKVQVNYSELYGLSLNIRDIDPSFTVGNLELERQRTIARLSEEGMMDINSSLELPALPRSLAVISAETAAGYRDFMEHLHGNQYGFTFATTLFPAPMQGAEAPSGIIAALDTIAQRIDEFDAVLILRGGGSVMDLVCFDDYELALNVAQFPLPVLTGIGHDKDYHVIDMVAWHNLKTPTALADFFIEMFVHEEQAVAALISRLKLALKSKSHRELALFDNMKVRIRSAVSLKASEALRRVDLLQTRLIAANPRTLIEKGYLVVLKDGRRIATGAELVPGERLKVMFSDAVVECEVVSSEIKNNAI